LRHHDRRHNFDYDPQSLGKSAGPSDLSIVLATFSPT
jgi:hypothetical protein